MEPSPENAGVESTSYTGSEAPINYENALIT
jgi:hypothetical protein